MHYALTSSRDMVTLAKRSDTVEVYIVVFT